MIFFEINFWVFFFNNLLTTYGALIGVLITAGFTLLFYNASLRDKNFYMVIDKYETRCISSVSIIAKLEVKDEKIINMKNGLELYENEEESAKVANLYNLFSQISMLWDRKKINKKMTYHFFSNILENIYEKRQPVIDVLEKNLQYKNVSNLYKKFKKIDRVKASGKFIKKISEEIYYF